MTLKSITITGYNSETFYPLFEDRCEFLGETEKSIKFKIGPHGMIRYLNKELFERQDSKIIIDFDKIPALIIYDADIQNEVECLRLLNKHFLENLEHQINFRGKVNDALDKKYQETFN